MPFVNQTNLPSLSHIEWEGKVVPVQVSGPAVFTTTGTKTIVAAPGAGKKVIHIKTIGSNTGSTVCTIAFAGPSSTFAPIGVFQTSALIMYMELIWAIGENTALTCSVGGAAGFSLGIVTNYAIVNV